MNELSCLFILFQRMIRKKMSPSAVVRLLCLIDNLMMSLHHQIILVPFYVKTFYQTLITSESFVPFKNIDES